MTYTNSNITIEEYIRLYDVKEPVILDTADLVIAQEDELKAAYSKIEALEHFKDYIDFDLLIDIINEIKFEMPEEKTIEFVDNRCNELLNILDVLVEKKRSC